MQDFLQRQRVQVTQNLLPVDISVHPEELEAAVQVCGQQSQTVEAHKGQRLQLLQGVCWWGVVPQGQQDPDSGVCPHRLSLRLLRVCTVAGVSTQQPNFHQHHPVGLL